MVSPVRRELRWLVLRGVVAAACALGVAASEGMASAQVFMDSNFSVATAHVT